VQRLFVHGQKKVENRMKPRKPSESDADYIKRLETANAGLREDNKAQSKYARKISKAVTWLACDASLAFQAMAEKAGVRSHPSVTAVVKAFDTIAHPQWTPDNAEIGDLAFPQDWDLDPPNAWSGDADMELNSGIAAALEYIAGRRFNCKEAEFKHLCEIADKLEKPLQGIIDKIMPERAERKPVEIPDEATRDDLANTINELSWRALDLAQDMAATNEMLRRDLRAASYRRICGELYELSNLHVPERNPRFDLKVIGGEAIPF
jgi:hypothetical protein